MLQELINFTKHIDEEFKGLGSSPKEGLHIILDLISVDNTFKIDMENYQFEIYSKKNKDFRSDFLEHCKTLHQNAWCIDTNKCFDLPTKAIHSCSPFCVAFKREHIEGGKKYQDNAQRKKTQIYERFDTYFDKAFSLIDEDESVDKYADFRLFFTKNLFSQLLLKIEKANEEKRLKIQNNINLLTKSLQETKEKTEKDNFKVQINELSNHLYSYKSLEDSDYIIFYLNLPVELYKSVHARYLDDKLFNTDKYNTKPNEEGKIFGTSNFMNGFNSNMPFLMHQTATFDITGRISNVDARLLNDFKNILPNKTLPNPLPIFIYKEEMQQKTISIFRESGFKFGYKEIIEKLSDTNQEDLANYYLLNWQNTKDGIIFKDFDFVPKFEYKLKNSLIIQNLFEIKDREENKNKHYLEIKTVFDIEHQVFKSLIQNKYLGLSYFGDLDPEDYKDRTKTPNVHYSGRFLSYSKYRKAVYDFVYKSQRNTIDGNAFYEMVFNGISDDIKINNGYGIKEKLNIWYSLFEYFNPKAKINMVNKLKEYENFVGALIAEEPLPDITDEKFAFAAGQVIEYILSKSKSVDKSYSLLEPYLQQAKCAEFKKAITNDFGRYKHENFSKNFEKVAAFVLSYETDTNLKHLLPQILSGIFAKNQLFSSKS